MSFVTDLKTYSAKKIESTLGLIAIIQPILRNLVDVGPSKMTKDRQLPFCNYMITGCFHLPCPPKICIQS